MHKLTVLLSLIVLIFMSCQQEQAVKYSTQKNGFPEIALKTKNAKAQIVFTGNENDTVGSIYFLTQSGKTWLKGEPTSVKNNLSIFDAVWNIDGRKIDVNIENQDSIYVFSFNAIPDDDILGWGFGLAADSTEYFTGLFERTVDGVQTNSWKKGITEGMNLHGQQVDMIIKPTLSLYCPFYLSSNGYSLFVDGTWPGKYDFCKTYPNRVLVEFEGPDLSGRIYTSKKPADMVKAHSLNVGPSFVPPKWAFIPWRWRDNHVNKKEFYNGTKVTAPYNSQVVEDILMMKAYDIPCGAYWVDRPWAKEPFGYGDFDWDPERFPQAQKMINWIHSQNIRFLVWIAPWVAGNMRDVAYQKGYTQPMLPHYGVDSTKMALLDFTNKEACLWWQQNGIEKMLKEGVDGFKMDRSEETITASRDIILHDGRTSREVRNEYPVDYVRLVNESCHKIKGDDFMLIPRAGYTGSSKYSGFWGGDIGSPAEGLRTAIIALQRAAVIGFPIWGTDIGGYWQADLDREVTARWLAFGCFTPIMELGPTEDRAPWDMDSDPNYDTELIAVWRLYAKIHAKLADYSLQLAKEAHNTGMPPARPLFLTYPEQKEAWTEWQNFMYGPDILVHAIWQKGTTKAKVYLPAGDSWIDAWNPENVFEGGKFIEIETPMYKEPIFIRKGSPVDLGDLKALFEESMEIAKNKPDLKALETGMKW